MSVKRVVPKSYKECYEAAYQPLTPLNAEEKFLLHTLQEFTISASNYGLYQLQKVFPGELLLCSYDPMIWLPPEVLYHMLSFLDIESVLACAFLNKAWNWFIKNQVAWKMVCAQEDTQFADLQPCLCPLFWLDIARDIVCVRRLLRSPAALKVNRVKFHEIVGGSPDGQNRSPPDYVIASLDVLCIVNIKRNLILFDTNTGSSYVTVYPEDASCFRLVGSNNMYMFVSEAVTGLFGKTDGTLFSIDVPVPLGHFLHSSAILSCDFNHDCQILASLGRDYYLKLQAIELGSTVLFYMKEVPSSATTVHVLSSEKSRIMVVVSLKDGHFLRYCFSNSVIQEYRQALINSVPSSELFKCVNVEEEPLKIERFENAEFFHSVIQKDVGVIGILFTISDNKGSSLAVYDAFSGKRLHYRKIQAKVLRLVGAGRRLATVVATDCEWKKDRVLLIDLKEKDCIINSVSVPHNNTRPDQLLHGCCAGNLLNSLPLLEYRQKRMSARNHFSLESLKRAHEEDGEATRPHMTNSFLSLNSKSNNPYLSVQGDDCELRHPRNVLSDTLSSPECSSCLSCYDKYYSTKNILYTGYDCETNEVIYVTLDFFVQGGVARSKFKDE